MICVYSIIVTGVCCGNVVCLFWKIWFFFPNLQLGICYFRNLWYRTKKIHRHQFTPPQLHCTLSWWKFEICLQRMKTANPELFYVNKHWLPQYLEGRIQILLVSIKIFISSIWEPMKWWLYWIHKQVWMEFCLNCYVHP